METKYKKKKVELKVQKGMDASFDAPVYHEHDGIDQPRLWPKFFHGYPIYSAAPTHKAEEGTLVLANFGGFVYWYTMLNKVWNLMSISPAFTPTNDLTVNSITIGTGGTQVKKILSATGNLNFGAIPVNSAADLTINLTGAVVGDTVSIGVDDVVISTGVNCADITFFAWVSAAGVVKIRCLNGSAVNIANPANGTFRVTVIQF